MPTTAHTGRLPSENPKNGLKAISAFFRQQKIPRTKRGQYDYVFEHGQLWIAGNNAGIWSVVDEVGPLADYSGFGFECVTEPQEDA